MARTAFAREELQHLVELHTAATAIHHHLVHGELAVVQNHIETMPKYKVRALVNFPLVRTTFQCLSRNPYTNSNT